MWIAKPLGALTQPEQEAWKRALAASQGGGEEAPFAQTLEWGQAIAAVSGSPYLVFSPDELVGGLVFVTRDALRPGRHFECVNGPLINWKDPAKSPRQLATFAMAVSKLEADFASLSMRPRWREGMSEARTSHLPIQPFAQTRAATLQLSLKDSLTAIEARFHPRLRRSLKTSEAANPLAAWETPEEDKIREFHRKMDAFSRAKGFSVPPLAWFLALARPGRAGHPTFALATVQVDRAECQILIVVHGLEAHYLFGHETRPPGLRAAISPSALAHRLAIRKAHEAGLRFYDFNGFLEEAPPDHPYAGVCRFKSQFGAQLIRYEVPEFRIE